MCALWIVFVVGWCWIRTQIVQLAMKLNVNFIHSIFRLDIIVNKYSIHTAHRVKTHSFKWRQQRYENSKIAKKNFNDCQCFSYKCKKWQFFSYNSNAFLFYLLRIKPWATCIYYALDFTVSGTLLIVLHVYISQRFCCWICKKRLIKYHTVDQRNKLAQFEQLQSKL